MQNTIHTDFKKSKDRFIAIDIKNFNPCLCSDLAQNIGISGRYLEYRTRKSDNVLCIIEFYPDGKGYAIYVQESN